MNEATIALTAMSGLMLVIFAGFLIWGIRSGQFRDVEEPKHRMLEDDDESAPGSREDDEPASRPSDDEGGDRS